MVRPSFALHIGRSFAAEMCVCQESFLHTSGTLSASPPDCIWLRLYRWGMGLTSALLPTMAAVEFCVLSWVLFAAIAAKLFVMRPAS